jgi:hypothetical protein
MFMFISGKVSSNVASVESQRWLARTSVLNVLRVNPGGAETPIKLVMELSENFTLSSNNLRRHYQGFKHSPV